MLVWFLGSIIVEHLSHSSGGEYHEENHTVTWSFAFIEPEQSGILQIQVKAECYAKPGHTLTNVVEMEGNNYYSKRTLGTQVCCGVGQIIYVDRDATSGCNNGTSWDNAYIDLQDALTNAQNCLVVKEIRVAEGSYCPSKRTDPTIPIPNSFSFQLVNGVAIKGGYAGVGTPDPDARDIEAYPTILTGDIDGDDDGDVLRVVKAVDGIGSATTIDGFTITKGSEEGIYCCDGGSPNISNNIIKENYCGIYCINDSSPEIKDCLIQDNASAGISCNYCVNSTVKVDNCIIADNISYNYGYGIYGHTANLTVSYCTIQNNSGDGIFDYYTPQTKITNSKIRGNGGCGIYCQDIMGQGIPVEIKNNWIHDNGSDAYDHGIYINNTYAGTATIRNNTIVRNTGYGISSSGAEIVNISNCIIWGNNNENEQLNNCSAIFSWTDDPVFINPGDPDDLHIGKDSSDCVDKGDPDGDYIGENDIDGNPRVSGGRVDIGGDEDFKHCFPEYEYIYDDWVKLHRPNCWLELYQCDGDADNAVQGLPKYRVYTNDFDIMVANWKKVITDRDFNPCADFDHKAQGLPKYRVYTNDFNRLVSNWKKPDTELQPPCLDCQSYQQSLGKTLNSQEIDKWLEQIWLDEEVQKLIDKDVLLKFIESLKEEL